MPGHKKINAPDSLSTAEPVAFIVDIGIEVVLPGMIVEKTITNRASIKYKYVRGRCDLTIRIFSIQIKKNLNGKSL